MRTRATSRQGRKSCLLAAAVLAATPISAPAANRYWGYTGTSARWDGNRWAISLGGTATYAPPAAIDDAYLTCNWNTTVTRDSTTASLYPTIHNVYIQGTGDAYVDLSQDSGSFSAHWMGVGYYGNGSFTHNGGTNVLSTLSVGEGAYGRYDLNYGTLLAGTLSLGLNGDGSTYGYFQQTAGTASIQFLSMGANSGGTGQCNMLGGSLSVGSAIIGDEGAGYFVLDSATANFTASGSIMIGRAGTGTSVFSHGLGTLSAGELVAGAGGQALYVLANTASLHTTGDQIFGGNLDTGSAGIGTMVSVTRTTPAAACVEISSIDPAATHEAG